MNIQNISAWLNGFPANFLIYFAKKLPLCEFCYLGGIFQRTIELGIKRGVFRLRLLLETGTAEGQFWDKGSELNYE